MHYKPTVTSLHNYQSVLQVSSLCTTSLCTSSPPQLAYLNASVQLSLASKQISSIYYFSFQNKVLRNIVSAPWYIRNSDLHRDLEVDVVSSEIQRFAQKHEERLHHHEEVEAIQLLDNMGIVRRLQRKKTF